MVLDRVDYAALAKSFDCVLCNDITKLFYCNIDGEYNEPEQINGFIDNSEEIKLIEEHIDDLENKLNYLDSLYDCNDVQYNDIQERIDQLKERIDELEQDNNPEIFQYYIISNSGKDILTYHTDEIVYYLPTLDSYVWGVTHYGTSWDYVLTDIKIDE